MSKTGPTPRPAEERFWRFVSPCPNTGCWFWTGSVKRKAGNSGYEAAMLNGGGATSGRPVRAARLSYEMHKGPIGDGLFVCHGCDNPLCVNPDHLFLGTNADNMRDCVAKGRLRPHAGGHASAARSAKLTAGDVLDIRRSSEKPPRLAEKYGVTATLIRRVQSGKAWRHVQH